MISEATKRALQQLAANESSYRPDPAIARQLASKTIIMLVGATCEGKSTLMHEVARLDPRFGLSGTFTSRPPRTTDGGHYSYITYSDAGLAPLFEKIKNRELVQYAINFNLQIYGSELKDYNHTYNLLDVFSSAMPSFQKLGFGKLYTTTVVSRPDTWLKRFEERFPHGHEQRAFRRDEAIESFRWSLAQTNAHFWIENIDDTPRAGALAIIDIILSEGQGNPAARQYAEDSLALAGKIEA